MVNLSFNQMCVLSAVANQKRYGLEIIKVVQEESGIKLVLGSLYNILHKLEKEGLVKSSMGEATAERGGNRRKYYEITAMGETQLNKAQSGLSRLWGWDLGLLSIVKKKFPKVRFGLLSIIALTGGSEAAFAGSVSSGGTPDIWGFLLSFSIIILVSARIFWFLHNGKHNTLAIAKESFQLASTLLALLSLHLGGIEAIAALGFTFMFLLLDSMLDLFFRDAQRTPFSSKTRIVSIRNVLKYFSFFLPIGLRENILGDLIEFHEELKGEKVNKFLRVIIMVWQCFMILLALARIRCLDFVTGDKKKDTID